MKRMLSEVEAERLVKELRDLKTRNDDELKTHWRELYGTKPPPKIHRSLLIAAIAYRMQANAMGALKPGTRHMTQVLDGKATPRRSLNRASLHPRAGTLLVRDWGGVTHQVKVLEGGFLFRGQTYKSLSEVARVITGARWSGPLFFGLKAFTREQRHGTQ